MKTKSRRTENEEKEDDWVSVVIVCGVCLIKKHSKRTSLCAKCV